MMSNVPEIRFKGYTDAWEQRKLGEVTEFNPRSVLPESFEYVDLESVVGTTLISHRTESKDTAPSRAQRLAKKGDVFFQTVRPYQQNNYLFDMERDDFVFSTGYAQLRPNIGNYFLLCLLQEKKFVTKVLDNCTGTSYPAISSTALADIDVNIAVTKAEQTAIGNFFRTLDTTVTLHKRKLNSLKELKKGYLQQMFPHNGERAPKLRFDGFSSEWEYKKLGEVAEIIGGGTPDTTNSDYWDGPIEWYSPVEIGTEIYAISSQRKITELGLKRSSAKILPANRTILFTSRAGIGDMAILKSPAATNQGFQSLVVNDDFDVYFVFSMGNKIKEYALKNASGSTFLEISGKGLSKMEMLIPSVQEQAAIGDFFCNFDKQITGQQAKIDKLKQLKHTYLQRMFI